MAVLDIVNIGIQELSEYCLENGIEIIVGDGKIRRLGFTK